jgi:hypothetical protein
MIKELSESEGSVLGFEVTRKVSLEEEIELQGVLNNAIETYGKISVLLVLGEQASWDVKAGIEDLKWLMKHFKHFNKMAVVSESNVWKWLVALNRPFTKLVGISEKHFEPSKMADAWSWIKE